MKKNVKDILKGVGYLAGAIGGGIIAEYAVKMLVPCNINRLKKCLVLIGSMALSNIVAEIAGCSVATDVDRICTFIENVNSGTTGKGEAENDI